MQFTQLSEYNCLHMSHSLNSQRVLWAPQMEKAPKRTAPSPDQRLAVHLEQKAEAAPAVAVVPLLAEESGV